MKVFVRFKKKQFTISPKDVKINTVLVLSSSRLMEGAMTFIENMYRDEFRDGWLVRAGIKKSWNKMLEMWQEIDRICRKYKLNYWAYGGTLLGAVRHGGFVPWDTDLDLCMMRPEYNIFCDAVEHELIQEDGLFEVERKDYNNYRLALSTTTMLGRENLHEKEPNKTHGMLIEVYPLDINADNTLKGDLATLKLLELISSIIEANYLDLKERAKNNQRTYNEWQIIENFHSLNEKDRQEFYKKYSALLFDKSSAITWIGYVMDGIQRTYTKEMFRETLYLPFETIKMPVPVDYEKILTELYGDWHKFVYDHTFRIGSVHSPDIPYKEFLEKVDLNLTFMPEEKSEDKDSEEEKGSSS